MGTCSIDPARADAATQLCTSCGLCCTGALHKEVYLPAGEVGLARDLGLEVREQERVVFALPCPHLRGSLCSIFERRPSSCGYYRCQLLQDLDARTVGLDQALQKVQVAKSLVEDARRAMPEGMTLPEARAVTIRPSTGGKDTQSDDARFSMELKLRMTALTFYLDHHFMNADDGKYFAGELIDRPRTKEAAR